MNTNPGKGIIETQPSTVEESSGSNKRAAQQNMEQDCDAIESSMRGLHLYERKPDDEDTEWDDPKRPMIGQHEVLLDDVWAPDCEFDDVLRVRIDTLRQRLAQEGITQIPNYSVFDRYIVNQDRRSFAELVEYTKNRMWLEKHTRYREIYKQQWRQHGFRSKVVSRSPYITSAEARALQLWVEDIMGDFVSFINRTQDPPPEKYWFVIYGFAYDIPNPRF